MCQALPVTEAFTTISTSATADSTAPARCERALASS
jgi:hypothetical protein